MCHYLIHGSKTDKHSARWNEIFTVRHIRRDREPRWTMHRTMNVPAAVSELHLMNITWYRWWLGRWMLLSRSTFHGNSVNVIFYQQEFMFGMVENLLSKTFWLFNIFVVFKIIYKIKQKTTHTHTHKISFAF